MGGKDSSGTASVVKGGGTTGSIFVVDALCSGHMEIKNVLTSFKFSLSMLFFEAVASFTGINNRLSNTQDKVDA